MSVIDLLRDITLVHTKRKSLIFLNNFQWKGERNYLKNLRKS